MSDIQWVCLSDTHFGAENSLLSHVPDGSVSVDPKTPSAVLEALVRCLQVLCKMNAGARKPTLVLNGDILELALAQDNVAAMAFDRFIDLAFDPVDPLFDSEILYIPGNHDHHLWETARERQYAAYVASVSPSESIGPPWHVTRLFARGPLPEAELVTALVRRRIGQDLNVRVAYPNLGVCSDDGERFVLFHHGHFVEPLYRLMSLVKASLFPGQAAGKEIWDWEADNFAWIDFFWSTLGRSGDAGEDVGLIYDMLQDEEALARLAGNLGNTVARRLPAPIPPLAEPAVRLFARWLARRIGGRERAHPEEVLTDTGRSGLTDYVAGPLLRQLERERPGSASRDVSFVFGHTHKPFECQKQIIGFSRPVMVLNTGGWVVDTECTAPLQGAAVVLVDEDCHLASLRFYNQAEHRSGYGVHVAQIDAPMSGDLPRRIASSCDFSTPPWTSLSDAVAAGVQQRHSILPEIIRQGVVLTRQSP
jgi:hypothetical protein